MYMKWTHLSNYIKIAGLKYYKRIVFKIFIPICAPCLYRVFFFRFVFTGTFDIFIICPAVYRYTANRTIYMRICSQFAVHNSLDTLIFNRFQARKTLQNSITHSRLENTKFVNPPLRVMCVCVCVHYKYFQNDPFQSNDIY